MVIGIIGGMVVVGCLFLKESCRKGRWLWEERLIFFICVVAHVIVVGIGLFWCDGIGEWV